MSGDEPSAPPSESFRASVPAALVVVSLALFTDMMIYGLVVPILPRVATELGASEGAIGALFGSYAAALLLATPVFGVFTDRRGTRAPMLWGLLALGLSTFAFGYGTSYWVLLLARTLQGVSGAATWTAGLSLLAQRAPRASRGKLMGTVMTWSSMGMLLGPPLGGALYEWGGYRAPFAAAGALALLDGVARALLIDPPTARRQQRGSLCRMARERRALFIVAVVVVTAAVFALLDPTLPLHLERALHASPTAIGLLFALVTLLYASAAPLAGAAFDRLGARPVVLLGLSTSGACLVALAFAHSWPTLALAAACLGAGAAFAMAPTMPEIAAIVERDGGDTYGSAYAAFNGAYAIGMTIGPFAGGWGMQAFGFERTVLAAGIVCGVVTVGAALILRPARRGRPAPSPP